MKNLKWLFGIFLMIVLTYGGFICVNAEQNTDIVSEFIYIKNEDGTITISGYTGSDETVIVPSEIDGNKVRAISDNRDYEAFKGCKTIKHLIIKNGITEINRSSFALCENLETVNLPDSITTIGEWVFAGCHNLLSINIPDTVESIGWGAFDQCIKLSKINLPDKLQVIEQETFMNCKSLTNIELPNRLIEIGSHAFAGCNNLKFLEIPNGTTTIKSRAFLGCEALTKVIIPSSVNIISHGVFESCIEKDYSFILTKKNLKNVIICANPNSYAREYANNNGIKFSCIGEHLWDNGIISIEPQVKTTGERIYTCTACGTKKSEVIPSIILPSKGERISDSSSTNIYTVTKSGYKNGTVEFSKTSNVKRSISIPDDITVNGVTYKVTSIAKNAFKNNRKIKIVTIGCNITKIKANAFNGCKNLKTINIKSQKIKTVGKNSFKGIKSNAKIKVPLSKLKKYAKLFKNKGQKSTVKITK